MAAVVDQAAFSGSNFVLNILLARWLGASGYGIFSLAFAMYLLASGLHNSLILEPISVLGTGKYSGNLRSYLLGQLPIHAVVGMGLGCVAALLGYALHRLGFFDENLSAAITGMGAFLPLMLLIWLARRTCYVSGRPGLALAGSSVYAASLLAGLSLLAAIGRLPGIWMVFGLMGLAALAGSAVIYVRLGINLEELRPALGQWASVLAEQWRFGRWIVLATFLNFAGTQMQLVIVAALLGLQAAGSLSAIQNFMLPMLQVVAVIQALGLPAVALEYGRGNFREMQRKGLRISAALVVLCLAYFVLLLVAGRSLEGLLYAGEFAAYAALIPLAGMVPLIMAIESAYTMIVRSMQRPVYYAVFTALTAATGTGLGWLLIRVWGLAGAVLSLVLVAIVSLATALAFYRAWFLPRLISFNRAPA